MLKTVRWNLAISQDTDQALRMFLADTGGSRRADLSRFVETAVRTHIFQLTAEQIKTANANISETDLSAIVEEAMNGYKDNHGD